MICLPFKKIVTILNFFRPTKLKFGHFKQKEKVQEKFY